MNKKRDFVVIISKEGGKEAIAQFKAGHDIHDM